MKMKSVAAAAALFAVAAPAFAAGQPTLADVLAASGVSLNGRVDVSYDYANVVDGGTPANAAFNQDESSFVVHQAAVTVSKTAGNVGATATVLAGEDAFTLSGEDVLLLEGYLSYKHGNLDVKAGRLLTLAGAEVIDSSADTNFNATRGLLFGLQPAYHTGVRAAYKVSDTLTLTGGLMNSVFPADRDSGTAAPEAKTVELSAALQTGPVANVLTVYVGDEDAVKDAGRFTLVDYVGSTTFGNTTLALNADYLARELSNTNTADGYGFAAYANQKLGPACRVAARAEYVHNNEGSLRRNLSALTLTYGHKVAPALEIMTEARVDTAASDDIYDTNDGNTQLIGTIKAVYKF